MTDNVIHRAPRDKYHPYVIVSRKVVDDRRISLAAKGALFIILSKPDDWHVSATALANECGCGRAQMASVLRELEDNGYLLREKGKDEHGQWRWRSEVRETPSDGATVDSIPMRGPSVDSVTSDGETIARLSSDGLPCDILSIDLPSISSTLGVPKVLLPDGDADENKDNIPFVDEPTPEPAPIPVLVDPKPKREPKPRAPSEWQTQRHALGTVFADATGLSHDGQNYAAVEKRWWSPLKAVLGAAGGDMERARSLILLAIQQMRRNQLTISSPQSVEQIAIALSATTKPAQRGDGNAGTYQQQERDWRAW